MSSLKKMLAILDLFSPDRPVWSAEEVIVRSGHTRPTGYRYVKELCAAGLLKRSDAGYSLGPRVIELDYYIRQSDPLLNSCKPVMRRLARETGFDVLLASMYGYRILAVHHEVGVETSDVVFGRGRPMPLFRGGGSKVILAHLPDSQHKKVFERFGQQIAEAGLGNSLVEFRKHMGTIRQEGYVVSMGELDPDAAGIAVPVSAGDPMEPSALVMVTSTTRFNLARESLVVEFAKNAAQQIEMLTRGAPPADQVVTPRRRRSS